MKFNNKTCVLCNHFTFVFIQQKMPQLEEKLHEELAEDACVIACRFPLPNWKESATSGKGIDTVWLYKKKSLSHYL